VTDGESGPGIPGATVTAVELGRSTTSDADGAYELAAVPGGTYTLRAAKTGYATKSLAGVAVADDAVTTVNIPLAVQPCSLEFTNGSFESSLSGWSVFGSARNKVVDTSGGGWFGGITAYDGTRFHGNEVNAGLLPRGGLWQQACAVPGHRYRATVWSNIYWIGGVADDATSRIGVDPGGGTDPDGPVQWSSAHRNPTAKKQEWKQIVKEAVATGPVLTVFLEFRQRDAASPPPGGQWRINCFDLVEVIDLDAAVAPRLRRGDCDGNAQAELTDAIALLGHLFLGAVEPSCLDACDSNDDGKADISDATFVLGYLFLGGPPPPAPGLDACGEDPTADGLDCAEERC